MAARDVKIIGHRGASAVAPENTMEAFREAIRGAADGVELDVHITTDGELAVVHDYLLERTTSGCGAVFAHAWTDLERLDAGSWYSAEFTGARIPRLGDVLSLPEVEFEIELKGFGEALVEAVLVAVAKADVLDRVEFTSRNLPLLAALEELEPSARLGLFSQPRQSWMTDEVFEHCVIGMAETFDCDVAHVYAPDVTSRIVGRLHRLGLEVHANDAGSYGEVVSVIGCGVDRLSTNDVASAVSARNSSP